LARFAAVLRPLAEEVVVVIESMTAPASSTMSWRRAVSGRRRSLLLYRGRRGRYATVLERLALPARGKKLGLWAAASRLPYAPDQGISTGKG
jgi:hypothetical protein